MPTPNLAAIEHMPWLEYRHALPDGRVCLRLRVGKGDFDEVVAYTFLAYRGIEQLPDMDRWPMRRCWRDLMFDYYEWTFLPEDPRVRYLFGLTSGEDRWLLDENGLYPLGKVPAAGPQPFAYAYAYPAERKPDWARGVVGYQIFPDRFRREGPPEEGLEPWDSPRVQNTYRFGGNLRGILAAVPYLKDLGVGLVYMTPLFLSNTSHRYNTFDYYQIDPLLGTLDDLKALTGALHEAGIRLLLDGVFNHCGLEFPPFVDAQKRGKASPYYDWFLFGPQYPEGYATYGYKAYMPKLNLQNEAAQRYFINVGRYWLSVAGIDGWRLDVSPEVWPDFWRRFRREVRRENPESLLIAECWDDAREWLTNGDMFDSTMNYLLSRNTWQHFADRSLSLVDFDARVNHAMMLYPHAVQEVLWHFLSTHDTPRFITRAGGDESALRKAVFFQMTFPGVPVVYYGDELGMRGGAEPESRAGMRWDLAEGNALFRFFQKLIRVRSDLRALRYGTFTTHAILGNVYAYLRVDAEQAVLVVLHTGSGDQAVSLPLPEALRGADRLHDAFSGAWLRVENGALALSLRPGEGLILHA